MRARISGFDFTTNDISVPITVCIRHIAGQTVAVDVGIVMP
jgi:hypothetical protein